MDRRASEHPWPEPSRPSDPAAGGPAVRTPRLARPAPLVPVALALGGGIALDRFLPAAGEPHALIFAGVLTAAGVALVWRHARWGAAIVLAALLGVQRHHASFWSPPSDHIARALPGEPALARIRGVVAGEPSTRRTPQGEFFSWAARQWSTFFVVDVEGWDLGGGWTAGRGRIAVQCAEPLEALGRGQRVEVFGRLSAYGRPANPGAVDWATWARRRGVWGRMYVEHAAAVRVSGDRPPGGPVHALRAAVREALMEGVPAAGLPEATLLDALVLGRRHDVDRALNEAFVRSGAAHFLATSGLHAGMLYALGYMVAAVFSRRRTTPILVAAGLVLVYALLNPPRVPILRATLMTVLFAGAQLLGAPLFSLNWLAAAAIVLLLIWPTELFGVGFQLSFAAVASILLLTPWLDRAVTFALLPRARVDADAAGGMPHGHVRIIAAPGQWWSYCLFVTLAAWAGSSVITAVHFRAFSLWGWATTLLMLPLVFLFMGVALVKTVVSLLLPTAGAWLGALTAWCATALAGVASALARLPGMYIEHSCPTPWVLACAAGAGGWLFWLARRPRPRYVALLSAVLILLVAAGLLAWLRRPPGVLTVRVLAVGAGTAVVIRCPDGQVWLYDAGSGGRPDGGAGTIIAALRADGVTRIDRAIISHPNLDHYAALPEVARHLRVRELVVSEYFEPYAAHHAGPARLLDMLEAGGTTLRRVRAGDTLTAGGLRATVLWPPPAGTGLPLTSNESSIVLRLVFAGRRVLLCGDNEGRGLDGLLDTAGDALAAEVVLAPHHGGTDARTRELLERIGAEGILCSSNRGSPARPLPLARIVPADRLFNTAEDGCLTVRIDEQGIEVTTFRTQRLSRYGEPTDSPPGDPSPRAAAGARDAPSHHHQTISATAARQATRITAKMAMIGHCQRTSHCSSEK